MDLDAYDDASIISHYYLKELEKPGVRLPKGTLRRFRLNLRNKKSQAETLSDACIELPRIDYNRFNTDGRYGFTYGVSLHPEQPNGFYNSIVKINVRNGKATYWHEEGCYPGEPCFIPAPESRHDADGLLMSIVLDTKQQRSFLLLLNADTLEEMARATVPEPVLYGFHGDFFAA